MNGNFEVDEINRLTRQIRHIENFRLRHPNYAEGTDKRKKALEKIDELRAEISALQSDRRPEVSVASTA